jgi:putative membrane protein
MMKLLCAALLALLLTACSAAPAAGDGEVIDITEKMYVTYINEIYTNTEDYIGKTIKIEGMFAAQFIEETGNTYYYVYRTGPGCCGNDGSMCGFEFTYGGPMPAENDWIEVVGKLRTYTEGEYTYLTLDAETVTVKSERGAAIVYQ